jgi:hypothetical protein
MISRGPVITLATPRAAHRMQTTNGIDSTDPTGASPHDSSVGSPPDAFRSILRRASQVGLRFVSSPWVFVALAAIGPLLWARPYGDLLYGQDSTRMFLPFSFNDSPFIPYSYLYSSTFPVPDYAPTFYLDGILQFWGRLGAPPWVAQRLQLGLFSAIAAAGVVLLLKAVDRTRVDQSRTRTWVLGVAVFAYLYNPFTLSITFWHVEGWLPFLAFLPWVVALAVRAAFSPRPPWRFAAIVVLLGTFLSPGAISSFAVPVSLVLLWAILAVWIEKGDGAPAFRSRANRTLLLLLVAVGIEAWAFVPFLLVPNVAYTSANYVTPENLLAVYAQASATWGPFPVLTLTAFGWLTRTPDAYPWIASLSVVAAAALVYPLVALLGAERTRTSPGTLLGYAIGLSVLPFLIGAGGLFTSVDEGLLQVGGPFLVIVAGFYVLGPVYLVLVVLGLYETLRGSSLGRSRPSRGWGPRSVRQSLRTPSAWVAIAVCGLLVVSASPFLTGDVYQTQGPNADAVQFPPSYSDLQQYFGTPANGPNAYVLVLPMSAQEGVFVDLGGSQFLDTSNALSSFVPYPVLEANTGPAAASLEEAFASGPPTNFAGFLAMEHVGWVVINAFANRTPVTMNEAPNGAPIDWPAIFNGLASQLGPGATVGAFTVYPVPGTVPIAWSPPTLVGVQTGSASQAVELAGSVTTGPPGWASALRGAVWDPNATLPGWGLRPVAVSGAPATVAIPPGWSATTVTDSGSWGAVPCRSGTCSEGPAAFSWGSGNVTVEGPVEETTSVPGDYAGAPPDAEGEYCSPLGGQGGLTATAAVRGPAVLVAGLTLSQAATNNWVNLQLSGSNASLLFQFWQNASAGPAVVGLLASYRSLPFAWHNVNLPGPVGPSDALTLELQWNGTNAFAEATVAGTTTSDELDFGNPGADVGNPGHNATNEPSQPIALTSANETVQWIDGAFCLASTSVIRSPQLQYLVAVGPGAPTSQEPGAGSAQVSSSGDFNVPVAPVTDATAPRYAVLGVPYDTLWTPSASNGASWHRLVGPPFDNVVELSGGSNGTVVTFHFRTYIELGLEASWFEVGGLLIAVAVASVIPPLRRWRSPSTNTPGPPSPGQPPGPAP